MPSGYTAAIHDGTDTSLRSYLMRIGRGMGFAIEQRDEDFGNPVRPVEEKNSYHAKALARYQSDLEEYRDITRDEALEEMRDEQTKKIQSRAETIEKKTAIRERYAEMLAKVSAWEVPEILQSTKDYAIKSLNDSIEFDVWTDEQIDRYYPVPTPLKTDDASIDEWIQKKVDHINDQIVYHTKEEAIAQERTSERNAHIQAFLDALPSD